MELEKEWNAVLSSIALAFVTLVLNSVRAYINSMTEKNNLHRWQIAARSGAQATEKECEHLKKIGGQCLTSEEKLANAIQYAMALEPGADSDRLKPLVKEALVDLNL